MTYPKNVQTEIDASFLYHILAKREIRKEIAEIFSEMSDIERSHAEKFLGKKLKHLIPSYRASTIVWLSKFFGNDFILSMLMQTEQTLSYKMLSQKSSQNLHFGDTSHVKILQNILENKSKHRGEDISRFEKQHKSVGGNALRAGVLGGNDGLVSNFSLIMGIAGATSGNSEIVLAGMAGLLAGALSMALGEWISVKSSQELYENQIALEKEELEINPEGEQKELELIYRAKGLTKKEAARIASEIMQNKEQAHHILVKEELGINTEDLQGSAMEAALTSFFLFAIGAVIPLVPFFFFTGMYAIFLSSVASCIGLFLIGGLITLFTGKSLWYSGLRQVFFGAGAAVITYAIGSFIGASII